MGNFSRDPINRLADSIAKHYVGVRMQQGVPLLDTDWNELEDLRKHELESLVKQFIGDGVPAGNDGFRIEGLAGGGVGTIVLHSTMPVDGPSSIEINFGLSTAASVLGFMPGKSFSQRSGSSPASLTGNASEPFVLIDGMTLTVITNGEAGETVTFNTVDFVDMSQATALEVETVLNAGLTRANAAVGTGNDFIILGGDGSLEGAGRILVCGSEVVNETDLAFTSQPLYENTDLALEWGVDVVDSLDAPVGVERTDLVYIDVWEREVGTNEDDSIVLAAVGMETTVRLKREWAIRVAPGVTDLSGITAVPNHKYLALALIHRMADEAGIDAEWIRDLRVQNLNIAQYLKTPIYLQRGESVLDAERFAEILNTLREILLVRLQNRVFDFNYGGDEYNRLLVIIAIQDITHECAFAAIQALTGNFNNADGFLFLDTLYDLQTAFVAAAETYGNVGDSAQDFIDEYRKRLDGSPAPDPIAGLKPSLDDEDFLGAAEAQDVINAWLSAPVDLLPEGSVLVSIQSVEPETNLALNVPFNIIYEIESQLISPRELEAYDISVSTASPSTWDISLNRDRVEMDAFGGRETVVLTVTPRAGTLSTQFQLTATAARNSLITFTHESDVFQIGQPPPSEDFFLWVSPPLDESGRIPIPQSDLDDDAQFSFQLSLINTSSSTTRTFEVVHYVIPPEGDVSGDWHPIEAEATPVDLPVDPDGTRVDSYDLFGPHDPPPDIDTEGTLVARATLIDPDPSPEVVERILELTFVITDE